MSTVLVVDDKEMMRDSVAQTLRRAGFDVVTATDGPSALETIARRRPDAVVTDLKMPGMTGIELVEKIAEIDDALPTVVMTAFGTIQTAVEAMKRGAFDFVTKPFEGDELIITVKRGLRAAGMARENAVLRASAAAPGVAGDGRERLIGDSPAMQEVRSQIEAVAASQGSVLITGESGTGKEVVARAIHEVSPRSSGAFLAVNCAALSESLLESELFGHERGAFTGADKLRKGRFELSDKGTLLLDEVSEVSPHIQAKLLRVLQERAFERVGSSLTIGVDVRVVATSNRDLQHSIDEGDFRGDLYYRLNVLPIHLPPLRERSGDVRLLAEHFVQSCCRREGRDTLGGTDEAMGLMAEYAWPGNVRELQNICERAVVISVAKGAERSEAGLVGPWLRSAERSGLAEIKPGGLVSPATGTHSSVLPSSNGYHVVSGTGDRHADSPGDGRDDIRPLCDIERETIVQTLEHFHGHRQKTAKALGIGVRTLGLKLKKWKEEQLVPATL